MKRLEWWQVLIPAYCAWNARDLLAAWANAPYEHGGWLCLLVWVAPLAVISRARPDVMPNIWLLVAALAMSLAGIAADANVVCDTGLALAVIAWAPLDLRLLIWAPACVLWMPASGWIAHGVDPVPLLVIRLVLSLVSGVVYSLVLCRSHAAARRLT